MMKSDGVDTATGVLAGDKLLNENSVPVPLAVETYWIT